MISEILGAAISICVCAVFTLWGFRMGVRYEVKKMSEAFEQLKKEFDDKQKNGH